MADKKERYKFTIQFNAADPNHAQVADILNQHGRRKAQFLVSAVLHYIHCKETPDIPQSPPLDIQLIEAVVRRILKEQTSDPPKAEAQPAIPTGNTAKPMEDLHFNEAVDALGSEGLAAIASTMAMFRKE